MTRSMLLLLLGGMLWFFPGSADATQADIDDESRKKILSHGPWPPKPPLDPSNRFSENREAIALGKRLFEDSRVSPDGAMACTSCHQPDRGLSDGVPVAVGRAPLTRNSPSLWNAGFGRWFGWGGENDSLWSHTLVPLTNPKELASSGAHLKNLLSSDPAYSKAYQPLTAGPISEQADEAVLVSIAKMLAAYQETLISPRTSFDRFRDALGAGDKDAMAAYPDAARRGLLLFVGKARCSLCHWGPSFTSGEFEEIGISYFLEGGGVDSGRNQGIKALQSSPYTRLGEWSDRRDGVSSFATRYVKRQHRDFGAFKVPGLRGVAETAPYMHNGSLATLEQVVRHYSEPPTERLHMERGSLIRPLKLSDPEISDLVAFLKSLSPN